MKRIALLCSTVLLVSCGGGSEFSTESSRGPKGNPNASVVVTEFADLQCPACKAAHDQIVAPILKEYGSDIRYEFKHFPIRSIHRYALEAAMSAECAADQDAFWEYIDIVFKNQSSIGVDSFKKWASDLGLDAETLEACRKSGAKKDVVLADYNEGRSMGVSGTPAFFVNGERVQTGHDTLKAALDEVLGGKAQRL